MASEEPASASASATKDMGLSPAEERLQKLEILLGKVAKHVGIVEDESSSEDTESNYGGSVVLEEPASFNTKKGVSGRPVSSGRAKVDQFSTEFFFRSPSRRLRVGLRYSR